MAAKRQKPPELLQGKGSRHAGTRSIALVRDPQRPVPLPPPAIRKVAKDEWTSFFRSKMSAVVDLDTDLDALRDWAWLVSERDRLRVQYKKCPLVIGSVGMNLVENPIGRVIERYSQQINRYRDQFGMTPLSRMRLGIAVGEAADVLAGLADSLGEAEPETVDMAEFGDVIEVGTA